MKVTDIYHKTTKGQAEVEATSSTLSMMERRVLILVNGEKDTAKLRDLSLCENILEVIETLHNQGFIGCSEGFIQPVDEDSSEYETTEVSDDDATASAIAARDFMGNTLLAYANRIRVAKLLDKINNARNLEECKKLVKPWYQAIVETPNGMYQADDLKKEVLSLIHNDEIDGS